MKKLLERLLFLDSPIRSIAIAQVINSVAFNLVAVFVPLIILKTSGSLLRVAQFYLAYATIKICLNYGTMRFIQKFSASSGLFIGFIAGASQLVCISLYTETKLVSYMFLGAGFLSLSNAFCWNAQHLYLSRTLNAASIGSNMATIEIFGKVLSACAPIVGAATGSLFGDSVLLAISSLLILTTLIPLRAMKTLELKYPLPAVQLRYSIRHAPLRDLLANFCFNIESAVGYMLWPVFLAAVVREYSSIGLISSCGMIFSLAMIRVAGFLGDKGRVRSVLLGGSILVSTSHFLRLLVSSSLSIGAIAALYQATFGYLFNAWQRLYYENSKIGGINYIISMEIACDVAYIFLWGLFGLLLSLYGTYVAFNALFIVAAFAAFGPLLMSRGGHSNLYDN